MTTTIKSFGKYSGRVIECSGEYILPVNDSYEVHPTVNDGWAVVASGSGEVMCKFANINDAVKYAEAQ